MQEYDEHRIFAVQVSNLRRLRLRTTRKFHLVWWPHLVNKSIATSLLILSVQFNRQTVKRSKLHGQATSCHCRYIGS